MSVELLEAAPEQQAVLGNLLELYMHDFTDYDDNDVEDDGRFGFDRLPQYFREPERHPFLVKVDGKYAGFALVREVSQSDGSTRVADMAEFFVMRKYRRKGVGAQIARATFGRFPGAWEVRVMDTNTPAQSFWRRVIADYTDGAFEERWSDDGRRKRWVLTFVAQIPND
jgi:predicted acetyltransferase